MVESWTLRTEGEDVAASFEDVEEVLVKQTVVEVVKAEKKSVGREEESVQKHV